MRTVQPPPGKRVKLLLAGSAGDAGADVIRRQAADLDHVVFLGALAQEQLNSITGAFTSDDFLVVSFSRFCIGK